MGWRGAEQRRRFCAAVGAAPATGSATFDTIGSSIQTLLGVYTGTSVNNLTIVKDDEGSAGEGQSQVVFDATSGTTYDIAVDGVNGAMGNIVLNWIQPTKPVFIIQPQSQTKYEGDSVIFSASAIGTPTPTYQWQFNGANISRATFASYTNADLSTNDAGDYTCIASNSAGATTSGTAVLTVLSSQATLANPVVTNGIFQLTVSKVSGLQYAILASTNLAATNWVTLETNTAPFTFTDSAFTNDPMRFYRAIYLP